jgi:hypothetical protein
LFYPLCQGKFANLANLLPVFNVHVAEFLAIFFGAAPLIPRCLHFFTLLAHTLVLLNRLFVNQLAFSAGASETANY